MIYMIESFISVIPFQARVCPGINGNYIQSPQRCKMAGLFCFCTISGAAGVHHGVTLSWQTKGVGDIHLLIH